MKKNEAEHLNRFSILLAYCLGLVKPSTNKENLEKARPLFDSVTAKETMLLVDLIIRIVKDMQQVKPIVTRMLHSFTKGLTAETRPFERGIPLIETFLEDNDKINNFLDEAMKHIALINEKQSVVVGQKELFGLFLSLEEFVDHYIKKENLLFPLIEQQIDESRCVALMWSIHDDIRATLKDLINFLESEELYLKEFNRLVGKLFFDMRSMIFREEQVLFPAIIDRLNKVDLNQLHQAQFEEEQVDPSLAAIGDKGEIDLITGRPTVKQLIQIFNNMPVDLTFVDENDKVVYFNTPEHRLFPRSKAVVGRSVQNCHPPESLDVVQQIVNSFKEKKESQADFRIFMKGRHILINYYAIYNSDGSYAGTMEVSQDITDLKNLEGEKRLLSWDK
jgi:PAS domain S-box-containing protein